MEILTGNTLYFDANIFIGINPQKCNQLRQLTSAKKVKCSCPPRVLIELLSNINSDENDKFKRYQAAFRKQKEICSFCILPYPQYVLADYFGLNRQFEMSPFGDFIITRGHIINSRGYDELLQKILGAKDLVSGQDVPVENLWHDFRENYERAWVDIVFSWVDNIVSSGRAKALYSLEFKRGFLNEMIQIAGGECANELPPSRVDELIKPIEAHFSAFMRVLEENKKQKYSHDNLKNYWNDLELLLYLGLEDHFFITDDKKLRGKVDDSCWQKKQILTFDEAIEKLKN